MSTDFERSIENFIRKAKKNPELVVRQVCIKLFSAVIKATPVDTGLLRNNWFATSGTTASTEVTTYRGTQGNAAIGRVTNIVMNAPQWDEFRLANNLPYAAKVEFGGYPGDGPNTVGGFSRQAPQGMVRVNVNRFQRLLDEAASRMN